MSEAEMSEAEMSEAGMTEAGMTEVEQPVRQARWPWGVVAGAAALAVASIVYFWLNRPEWGYCVDGEDFGFCDQGVFSSNAIVGTILVAVGLLAVLAVVLAVRGQWRGRMIVGAAVLFAVLLIAAWVLQFVALEDVQIPNSPPSSLG